MTDLGKTLPDFPTQKYPRLLSSFEKHSITTTDLLILDSLEIAKRTSLPVLEVKSFCNAVLQALEISLNLLEDDSPSRTAMCTLDEIEEKRESRMEQKQKQKKKMTGDQMVSNWKTISLLDPELDHALRGGIPTGSITELTGESGAGKTQFLLTLLLSAQMPAPIGLSCSSLYISTESGLPVTRLRQLLLSHPTLVAAERKPSLDRIVSIVTPDLECQDHIIYFQVPVAIQRFGIGLLIIDSVASNYRIEFDADVRGGGGQMGKRSSDLVKLGQFLRHLAVEMDLAIVVANQVADRIPNVSDNIDDKKIDIIDSGMNGTNDDDNSKDVVCTRSHNFDCEKTRTGKSWIRPTRLGAINGRPDLLTLEYQQCWFTGWGDEALSKGWEVLNLKTPTLGLTWTNQIACRIALIKQPIESWTTDDGNVDEEVEKTRREGMQLKWRRWMKIVFASHAPESGSGVIDAVEFIIGSEGIKALKDGSC